MTKSLLADLMTFAPSVMASRVFGFVSRVRRPATAVAIAKRVFVAASGLDLREAARGIDSYKSLEELFVRELRPGARVIDADEDAVISPADGTVGACGVVTNGTLLQVKGKSYSLAKLLHDEEAARRFEGGVYATFYLSPRDYHRVHAPFTGVVREARIVPGRLLPVFPEACERIDELFARNERFVTYLDTEHAGRIAVVKVGAAMVGRIRVVYDESAYTNSSCRRDRVLRYDDPRALGKGDELGVFDLGSTVVLIGEPGRWRLEDELLPGLKTRVGMRIGTVLGAGEPRPKRAHRRGPAKA